jgi:hypothetical protein
MYFSADPASDEVAVIAEKLIDRMVEADRTTGQGFMSE